jgi:hypothetical protein
MVRVGSGALAAATLAAYASPAGRAWASSSHQPEQLTMAVAWTGTQAAGVPPLLAVYNKDKRFVPSSYILDNDVVLKASDHRPVVTELTFT